MTEHPPVHDIRQSEEIIPEHRSSNARETVRASVNWRVEQLAARHAANHGREVDLIPDGEVFVPVWSGPDDDWDDEDDDD
jgi:hypothetical protein